MDEETTEATRAIALPKDLVEQVGMLAREQGIPVETLLATWLWEETLRRDPACRYLRRRPRQEISRA